MPGKTSNPSYGILRQQKTKKLLERILTYIDTPSYEREEGLEYQWENTTSPTLIIRTTLEFLTKLVDKSYLARTPKQKEQARNRVRYMLTHLMKEFMGMLEDLRLESEKRDGKGVWRFKFKLWSRNKLENLAKFDVQWEERRPEKGKELEKSIRVLTSSTIIEDFGKDFEEVPEIPIFYGRTEELSTLEKWITKDRCRLIALLGMGGIGKTTLCVKLVQRIQNQFKHFIWYSLRQAPPLDTVLMDLIRIISNQEEVSVSDSLDIKISKLLKYLRISDCLLVFDNLEVVLKENERTGYYREGFENYGELLKQIGEAVHSSCLILTSREKPRELVWLQENLNIRSLQVEGLTATEGQKIFSAVGSFTCSTKEWETLVNHYAGNPLALKIAASAILEFVNGNISEFIEEHLKPGKVVLDDIDNLISRQFNRLSNLEREIMYWLGINEEPTSLSNLKEDLVSSASQQKLIAGLESLRRRSMIECYSKRFMQQPVIAEYVRNKFIEIVCQEFLDGVFEISNNHALIKAQSPDYIRESQVLLILQPVIDCLTNALKGKRNVENQIRLIISKIQEETPLQPGYVSGNLINILCQMKIDLSGCDFSNLTIWQAYLRGTNLPQVSFFQSDLTKSNFTQTFGGILSVAFSPNGELWAAGDTNGKIRLWKVTGGQPVLTCHEHTNWIHSVAFSPVEQIIAGGCENGTVAVWNTTSGQCLCILQGHTGRVRSVAFSSDGKVLASGGDDRIIRFWNPYTGDIFRILQEHAGRVRSVVFSSDGKVLASGSDDQSIKIWDSSTGQCLFTLHGHTDWVRSVAFSPDGKVLASGGDDQTVKLWDYSTGQCLHILQGHSEKIRSVAFSPDGKVLASGGDDQTVKLWDCSTGQCLHILQGHTNEVGSVAFSPNEQKLISGSQDQTIRIWNTETGQCLYTLYGYINWIWSVTFSPDGKVLASGGDDQTIRIWDCSTGQFLYAFKGHTNRVGAIKFNFEGKLLVSSSDDNTIRIWDVETHECLHILCGHTDWVRSVAFSPTKKLLVSGSEDQTVRIWDVQKGKCLCILNNHTSVVRSVSFDPHRTIVASGSDDQTIKIWDAQNFQEIFTLLGHSGWIRSVAFSPDGKLLASGSDDQTVKIWNIHTQKCLYTFQGHSGWVWTVAFSPDGKLLASGSDDQTVKIWNIQQRQCLQTLEGHTNGVRSIAFNPDGLILASGSADETIRLWSITTGKVLKILRAPRPYEGMNITDVIGLTDTQKNALKSLGAFDSAV